MPSHFTFDSGRLCLDFMATLVDRKGAAIERLDEPGKLSEWLKRAGKLTAVPTATKRQLLDAIELREASYEAVQAAREGRKPLKASVECINRWAAKRALSPRLNLDGRKSSWSTDDPISATLSHIARDAIDLLASPTADSIRECSGTACSMLFVDISRAQKRRWCAMERCGNRSKKATFRKRQVRA